MRLLTIVVLLAAWGAQDRRGPPTVAIRGAKIFTDAGTVIEEGTIVLRGGFVESVGADSSLPADAEVIEGKGLFVYPGFIDGGSAAGLGKTQRSPEERREAEATPADHARQVPVGMQPANRKGIRPEFSAAEEVALSEEQIKKIHQGGFTTVHVAAAQEYLGGSGALVSANGGPRRESVVRAPTGMAGSFRSYGDGYPSTTMGVLTHLRQVFLDARHLRELRARYEKDPQGVPRPPADPALEALWPLLDRTVPWFMEANTANEIDRALSLAEEFKLDLVITGGREAGLLADRLKAAGVPVVIGLKLPPEPKRPKKPAPPKARDPNDPPEYQEIPKPKKQYQDEKREWKRLVRGATTLHEKGVPFCFSTRGLPDPTSALKKISVLVNHGLAPEAALRALTAAPARLFRCGALLGTLAPGRPANVTVLTAPIGSPEANVRYVFADGFKFAYESREKAAGPPEIDLTGVWKLTADESDLGPLEITLTLTQKGSDLAGTATSKLFEEGAVSFGRVGGKKFRFLLKAKLEGEDVLFEFRGEMKEGQCQGTVNGPPGDEVAWKAKKPE
ncbi:MAG: amidohydrolase family protein [Planctomycetes bacterium]|nr:amidohydrolase family protein [Planctomycetota bacterium]